MEQRFTFDQVASVYRAAHPDHPEALIDDAVAYARLKPDDAVLEVGCGTGQATRSFAMRGLPILAIDPGPEMVRTARETLSKFSNVRLVETTFETWPANNPMFQLIITARRASCPLPEQFKEISLRHCLISINPMIGVRMLASFHDQNRCSCDPDRVALINGRAGVCRLRPDVRESVHYRRCQTELRRTGPCVAIGFSVEPNKVHSGNSKGTVCTRDMVSGLLKSGSRAIREGYR